MASNQIFYPVDIRQNDNRYNNSTYGKYYPVTSKRKVLTTDGLIQHIAGHGSIFTEDVLRGVILKLAACLPELLMQGYSVKLDGLGTFYTTVKAKKGGAESIGDFAGASAENFVEGVHIRFQADGSDIRQLNSKQVKKKCSLRFANLCMPKEVTVGGKRRTVTQLIDFNTYMRALGLGIDINDPDNGSNGSNGGVVVVPDGSNGSNGGSNDGLVVEQP